MLTNVSSFSSISFQEAFGPVAMLTLFVSMDEAIAAVNDSRFGLQAGSREGVKYAVEEMTELKLISLKL